MEAEENSREYEIVGNFFVVRAKHVAQSSQSFAQGHCCKMSSTKIVVPPMKIRKRRCIKCESYAAVAWFFSASSKVGQQVSEKHRKTALAFRKIIQEALAC